MNEAFDVSRAQLLHKPRFKPFFVRQTQLLADAIAKGAVAADGTLLILEREAGVIAFNMIQMAYHHTAQVLAVRFME